MPSLFYSIALTATLLCFGPLLYGGNDDMAIISLLSGKLGISAVPDGVFISTLLSRLIYQLYQINNSLPWYGIINYLCLFVAFFLGIRILFGAISHYPLRYFSILVFSCLYAYMVLRMTFTEAGLFLWVMATAHLTWDNIKQQQSKRKTLLFGLVLGIAFMIRPSIISIECILFLPALSTFLIGTARKHLPYVLIPLVIIVFTNSVASHFLHQQADYKSYAEFNKVRSDLIDKVLANTRTVPYKSLAETGWSLEDFAVLSRWWIHDDNIFGTKPIKTFLSFSPAPVLLISSKTAFEALALSKDYLIIMLIGLTVLLAAGDRNDNEQAMQYRKQIGISVILIVAFICILTTFRFPPHIALPIYAYLLVLSSILGPLFLNPLTDMPGIRASILWFATPLLMYLIFTNYKILKSEHYQTALRKQYRHIFVNSVKRKMGDNSIFISTNLNAMIELGTPLKEYNDYLNYLRMPMGWMTGSPAYLEFLKMNGFGDRSSVVPAMIENPRAVLFFWDSPADNFANFENIFIKHLQKHYSPLFPNRRIGLETILDGRLRTKMSPPEGLIFFKIVARPEL